MPRPSKQSAFPNGRTIPFRAALAAFDPVALWWLPGNGTISFWTDSITNKLQFGYLGLFYSLCDLGNEFRVPPPRPSQEHRQRSKKSQQKIDRCPKQFVSHAVSWKRSRGDVLFLAPLSLLWSFFCFCWFILLLKDYTLDRGPCDRLQLNKDF